jgi:hypothetical protein
MSITFSFVDPGYSYSNVTSSIEADLNKSSIAAPLYDISRTVTLTATLTPLVSEQCQKVTLINSTTSSIFASINSGSVISIPAAAGYTFNSAFNTNEIFVSGSGTVGYIVSK